MSDQLSRSRRRRILDRISNAIDPWDKAKTQIAELKICVDEARTELTELRIEWEQSKGKLLQDITRLINEKNEAIKRVEKAERKLAEQKERARVGRLHAMETKNRLIGALKQLEWSGYRTHDLRQCPVCFSLKREGIHSENCFIAKALYPAAQESSEEKEISHEQ